MLVISHTAVTNFEVVPTSKLFYAERYHLVQLKPVFLHFLVSVITATTVAATCVGSLGSMKTNGLEGLPFSLKAG
jgi:hypothetical protein